MYIDGNTLVTDDGLARLAESLTKNTKLAHLSFKDCTLFTDDGLGHLLEVIRMHNTIIQLIEFTDSNYSQKLGASLKHEVVLNKAI